MKRNIVTLIAVAYLFSACGGGLMQTIAGPTPPKAPPEGMARVFFVFPATLGGGYIVEGTKLLGQLDDMDYFVVDLPPGKHLFMAIAQNTDYVLADLAVGKTYYIRCYATPGFGATRFFMIPTKAEPGNEEKRKKRSEWFTQCKQVELVHGEVAKWEEHYKNNNESKVQAYKDGKVEAKTLGPDDGE